LGLPLPVLFSSQSKKAVFEVITRILKPIPTSTICCSIDRSNVTFSYKKIDENGVEKEMELSVPILSIVPIPYIRIDDMTIDFTAKLTDTIEKTTKTGFKLDSTITGKYKAWWSPISVEFRTSLSIEQAQATRSKFVREYAMNINVRAVQDDMPAGLAKVLNILEQLVLEKPKATT